MPFTRKLAAIAVLSLCAGSSFALTSAEVKTEKDRISADYKAAHAQCKTMNGNAKDVCEKEAKGHENVAKAELDARAKPSDKAHYKVAEAKADAAYEIAKEKCDDLSGNAKDVCVKDAKAAHVKAKEDAKVMKAMEKPGETGAEKAAHVSEAKKEASAEKREADYKAAKERCDAMSGDTKTVCENDAKRQFGQ